MKNTILDIYSLYRNFFHWNISKIFIFIWSIILGFLVILPILWILILYAYFVKLGMKELFFQIFSNNLWDDLVVNIFLHFITFLFFIAYTYWYALLIKLNLKYLKWGKLKYLKNYYFNFSKIGKYFLMSFINIFILIIPFILLLIIILVLFLFIWETWVSDLAATIINWKNYLFVIISLILLIVSSLSSLYLLYRVYFSYFIFIEDDKNKHKILFYIKESFKLTKWFKKILKFTSILIIYLLFLFPIKFVWEYLENSTVHLNNYLSVKDITAEEEAYLKQNGNYNYYQSLKLEYSHFSDKELKSMSSKYDIYFILFNIFSFSFVYWLLHMILCSFYKRELLKK